MNIRNLPLPLTILTATLAASSFQPVHAQDAPPPPPPPRREGGFGAIPGDRPGDGPGDNGGPQNGPRGGRGEGGRGEGGPRREGGPRGEGGGGRPNETPEQRNARTLASYAEMIPDLTESQKTHIMVILNAVSMEATAIGADDALSPERKIAAGRALRGSVGDRIKLALTEAQLATYTEMQNEKAIATADMQKIIDERDGEDIEQARERAVKGYEEFLEEVSVKQKTQIIKFLEAADNESSAINEDPATTPAQKKEALSKVLSTLSGKVAPLLDAEQATSWKKAIAAKQPK